jgi:hypothetical protein
MATEETTFEQTVNGCMVCFVYSCIGFIIFAFVSVALGCDWVAKGNENKESPSACQNCGSTRGYYSQQDPFPSATFRTRCKDCDAVK